MKIQTNFKHPIASKAGTSPQGGEGLRNNDREIETNNGITDSFVEKLNEERNKDKETEMGM